MNFFPVRDYMLVEPLENSERKKDKPTLKALQLKRDLYEARKKAEANAIAARKVRQGAKRILN